MNIFKNINELFDKNNKSIYEFNQDIIPKSLVISMIGVLIAVFFSIFRESMRVTIPAYALTFVSVLLLYIGFKLNFLKLNIKIYIYALGVVFFLLVLYLSLIRFPMRPAGTALTLFVVAPLLLVDRSTRINLFIFSMYLIHTILSFHIKTSSLGTIDFLNTTISLTLGMLFGRLFLISRLKTFEMKRLLTIEKETDY